MDTIIYLQLNNQSYKRSTIRFVPQPCGFGNTWGSNPQGTQFLHFLISGKGELCRKIEKNTYKKSSALRKEYRQK